jgi:uncharacterized protein (TIGR02145 family)
MKALLIIYNNLVCKLSQNCLLVFVCILFINPIHAQETRMAKEHRKYEHYLYAVKYAAIALQGDLKKGQISDMQEILREDYVKAVDEFTVSTSQLMTQSAVFVNDSSLERIIIAHNVLLMCSKMNSEIRKIPAEMLKSHKKNDPDVIIELKPLTDDSIKITTLLKDYTIKSAELHYQQAMTLKKTATSLDVMQKVFTEFKKTWERVPNYKDTKLRLAEMSSQIGNEYVFLAEKIKAEKTIELEKKLNYYENAYSFDSTNIKIPVALSETKEKLLNTYYNQVKRLMASKESDSKIDNNYAAIDILKKMKAIDAGYKDAKNLELEAFSNTLLLDSRDGKSYSTYKLPNNTIWMTANLDYNISGSQYFNYKEKDGTIKYVTTSGRFYNLKQVFNGAVFEKVPGICPQGWHIPTKADFEYLKTFKLKSDGVHEKMNWQFGGDNQGTPPKETPNEIFWSNSGIWGNYITSTRTSTDAVYQVSIYCHILSETKDLDKSIFADKLVSGTEVYGPERVVNCRCVKNSYLPVIVE